jgi:thioredoxin-related protein
MRLVLLAAGVLLLASGADAQQPVDASVIPADAPEWRTLEGAVDEARDEGKLLLIHGYASWCGWCARLDEDVYTDDTIQAYIAEHFEGARLNIENRETVEFFDYRLPQAWLAAGLGVTSTPTTVFVDPASGETITRLPGYADAETFLYALQFVREGAYESSSFTEFMDARKAEAGGETPDADDEATPLIPLAD